MPAGTEWSARPDGGSDSERTASSRTIKGFPPERRATARAVRSSGAVPLVAAISSAT